MFETPAEYACVDIRCKSYHAIRRTAERSYRAGWSQGPTTPIGRKLMAEGLRNVIRHARKLAGV